ncbi:MAG TPA: hypothetical protein VEP90_10295, partial [Methylomirabilota bacterium]|nr:hypothetical protein [Methylomirabilota bacterium]
MVKSVNVGVELIQQGWRQGSMIKSIPAVVSWFTLETENPNSPGKWIRKDSPFSEDDYLVVISQVCDIQKRSDQEPFVEMIRAYWTSDKSTINDASKNSMREFLIRRSISPDGRVEGLIAVITNSIRVDKQALLTITPEFGFDEINDPGRERLFRMWLAKRYSRQAVPNDIVGAVQQPIVEAVKNLRKTHDFHRIFDAIWQIRFLAYKDDGQLYKVEMLLLYEDTSSSQVSEEDAATLAGWISDVLRKSGKAELIYCLRKNLKEI